MRNRQVTAFAILHFMQKPKRQPHIKVLWEHVDDTNTSELLRRVLELILNDPQEISPAADFDKNPLTELNEDVPVENKINQ